MTLNYWIHLGNLVLNRNTRGTISCIMLYLFSCGEISLEGSNEQCEWLVF